MKLVEINRMKNWIILIAVILIIPVISHAGGGGGDTPMIGTVSTISPTVSPSSTTSPLTEVSISPTPSLGDSLNAGVSHDISMPHTKQIILLIGLAIVAWIVLRYL